MSIKLARIDNRLLHGITATQWAPKTGANRVMVIDDEIANNPVLKESMKFARPAGMAISIISYETAKNNLKMNKYGDEVIFILTKRIETLKSLIEESGVEIKEINYGATAQRDLEQPGIIKINKFSAMNESEMITCRELIDNGVHVYAQYLIKDTPVDVSKFLK